MRVPCPASLPSCLLFGTLTALATGICAPIAAAQSGTVYPQTVRLLSVNGDVRIARGKSAEKAEKNEPGAHTGWEQAAPGLSLEAGYSLVTGDGKAEIELENASTLYLAPNSVLALDSLQSQNNVTYTEVSLLSGSLIINSRPVAPGDNIRLNTPTDHVTIGYPGSAVWRVDSYLDAIALTRIEGPPPVKGNVASPPLGRTLSYTHGRPVAAPVSPDAALLAWQSSAVSRIAAREAALAATMKQAGLSQPLPGLDQLAGKGTFFSCGEYGTCWEPKDGWDGKSQADIATTDPSAEALRKWTVSVKDVANPGAPPPPGGIPNKSGHPSPVDNYLKQHPGATFYTDDYTFPCAVQSIRELVAVDPASGKESIIASEFDGGLMDPYMMAFPHRNLGPNFSPYYSSYVSYDASWGYLPWDWTVCHSGAWIRYNHRYAWVASDRRHHHCPVRWVHNGHHQGYVPIHPRDVAGKPPLNLKYGLFQVDGKHSTVQRVNFEPDRGVKVLAEPPREFRNAQLAVLKMADAPRAEAHSAWAAQRAAAHGVQPGAPSIAHGTAIVNPGAAAKGLTDGRRGGFAESHHERIVEPHHEGVPINFDRKSQSFSVNREVSTAGGRQTTVSTPLGGGHAFGPTGAGGWNNAHAGGNNGGGYGGGQARGGGAGFGGGNSNSASSSRGFSGGGGDSGSGGSRGFSGGRNSDGGGASRGGGGGFSGGGNSGGSSSRGGGGGGGFNGGGGGGASHSGGGGGGGGFSGGGGGASHGGGGGGGGAPSSGGGGGASSGGGGHR